MEQKNEKKPKSFWKKFFWYVLVFAAGLIGGVVLGVIFPEKSKKVVYGITDAAKSGGNKVTGLFRKDNDTACAESVDAEREEVREKFYNNNNRHNGYQDRRRS